MCEKDVQVESRREKSNSTYFCEPAINSFIATPRQPRAVQLNKQEINKIFVMDVIQQAETEEA